MFVLDKEYYYDNEFNFKIEGKLKAIGTNNKLITFTIKDINYAWIHFEFTNSTSSSQSILKNCKIEYGKSEAYSFLKKVK